MKRLAFILILIGLMGAAQANPVDLVKRTRNSSGRYCSEIPKAIEQKLGYKALNSNWQEDKMDGYNLVTLKISAKKEVQMDSLYMSVAWNPEWIWAVNNQKVTPVNALAKNWMKGKI